MFPIKDDNPQINVPYGVYTLLALNILAWIVLQGAGQSAQLNASVCSYGLIPADLFSLDVLGSPSGPQVCPTSSSLGWMGVLSSMFMHGGWMHIIGNLWFLWVFGDNIEDAMGTLRFVIFYLLCGFAAAMAQVLSNPESNIPMVGASGAIGGVMGAYIVLYPRVKVHLLLILVIIVTTIRVPAMAMLGYWALVQALGGMASSGATGGTAFWAHIGGFVAGALLVLAFKDNELLLNHPYHGWSQKADPSEIWKDPNNQA